MYVVLCFGSVLCSESIGRDNRASIVFTARRKDVSSLGLSPVGILACML